MQDWPLIVSRVLEYAARWHPTQEIVCRTVEGPVIISSYADLARRARLCALALQCLGIRCGISRDSGSGLAVAVAAAACEQYVIYPHSA